MELYFPGPAIPKGRPRMRVFKQSGKVSTYTPEKTRIWETEVSLRARAAYAAAGESPIPYPTEVWMEIYIHRHFPSGLPSKKPDIINMASSILDALNTIAYDDDSQVTVLVLRKQEAEMEMVKVIVRPVL